MAGDLLSWWRPHSGYAPLTEATGTDTEGEQYEPLAWWRSRSGYQPLKPEETTADDDSSEAYSSEEEEEAEASAIRSRRGRWRKELAAPSLSEERLHIVAWGRVALYTAQNGLTVLSFLAFAALAHVPAVLSLPLFAATLLLLAICCEALQRCRAQVQVAVLLSLCLLLLLLGKLLGTLELLMSLAQLAWLPLLLTIAVLRLLERPWSQRLRGTPSWRALSGRRYALLRTDVDLARLLRGLRHAHEPRLPRLLRRLGVYDYSAMLVDAELGEEGIEPGEYVLTQLLRRRQDGGVDVLPLEDLEGALRQRRVVGERLLDAWLGPKETKREPWKKATKAGKVERWLRAGELPPRGRCEMVARFRRRSYVAGLAEHWAPRAVAALLLAAALAMPAAAILMFLREQRREMCPMGRRLWELPEHMAGVQLCGEGKASCEETCGSIHGFISAYNEAFGTSHAELFFVLMLLPVLLFQLAVETAHQQHFAAERAYFRRLQAPRSAIVEVMRLRAALEDVLTGNFLLRKLLTAVQACFGADAALAACGPISEAEFDLAATQGYNGCLREAMAPVTEARAGVTCERTGPLAKGVGYVEEEEGRKVFEEWLLLKERSGIEDGERSFKALFELEMRSEDSWRLFKSWCKREYSHHLSEIARTASAQDRGCGSHVDNVMPLHDVLPPRGFSLTHLYVTAMPDDGLPLQVEVKGDQKAFFEKCGRLERHLARAAVDDNNCGSALDRRLQRSPIVARFALSEAYVDAMAPMEFRQLCGANAPESFLDVCDAMLEPVAFRPAARTRVDGRSLTDLQTTARLAVCLGTKTPQRALLTAVRDAAFAAKAWLGCLALAMLVPVARVAGGGALFPAPLGGWLALNAVAVWLCLALFFSLFQRARSRLLLLRACLAAMEQGTLTEHATEDDGPFDLVVEDGDEEYEPGNAFWKGQWRQAHGHVEHWHAATAHLRVFASASRLLAQAALAAAAALVACLLLLSLRQLLARQEAAAARETDNELAAAAWAGGAAARRLQQEVAGALQVLAKERSSAAAAAAGSAALAVAMRRLDDALAPAHGELHAVLLRQHDALLKGARRLAGADASLLMGVATRTQLLTAAAVLFVLLYSVPLLWDIVLVNGFFDRHHGLLLKQKEQHRLNQARRSVRRKGGDSIAADAECRRYEQTLDMAIEVAAKARERFPLRLFGFVVSSQLLATWVALAAAPALSAAKRLGPAAAVRGCRTVMGSSIGATLQKRYGAAGACETLESLLTTAAQALPTSLTPAQRARLTARMEARAAKGRRLRVVPRLKATVRRWWRAHPNLHAEARLAASTFALKELARKGRRLLQAAPASVARSWRAADTFSMEKKLAAAMGAALPPLRAAAGEL